MPELTVFDHVTLDGFFVDARGDMSWAHRSDPEWNAFAAENAAGGGRLVFGRVTYDLMAGFWPTPQASAAFPAVAERMNHLPKIVFSRTMDRATWNNTTLVKGDIVETMRRMKAAPGDAMVILGSGSIVSQFAAAGLIDQYQVVVNPVILGKGRTLFEGVTARLPLRLVRTRVFANGNVLLCYEPSS